MIRILRFADRERDICAFDTMFEDRKSLFVDLLRWDVGVIDDRFEIDQFDRDGAVYVLALDDDGAHQGSLRLLPTDRPHLLGSVFASLCPLGVPTGPHIFEITRLCLPSRLGARSRLLIRNALISAMVDHALAIGITRLTGLVDAGFRREVLTMGWVAEPLGPATMSGGASLGAFALHIDPTVPARLGWNRIYCPDTHELRLAAGPDGSGLIGVGDLHGGANEQR